MKKLLLPLILLFSFSASAQDWTDYLGNIEEHFPDSQIIRLPWQQSSEIDAGARTIQPHQIRRKAIRCANKTLWPTHPQQSTKTYLHAVYANYDHGKLPSGSSACQTWSRGTRRMCLRATWAKTIVLSDTFVDACNQTYRGYWQVNFLANEESMGTLASVGRTFYPKPNSPFQEYVLGNTYPVPSSNFLILGEPLARDAAKIESEKAAALKQGMILKNRIFEVKR